MMGKKVGKKSSWVDPISRTIVAATIPGTGVDCPVEPTEAERAAVSDALDLDGVPSLKAEYRVARRAGGIILVKGQIKAIVRPTCVVSLEPFDLKINETVEMRFVEAQDSRAKPRREGEEEMLNLEGDDPPDVIENGVIDLGRVTTEFLSLAIPPFPRKQGMEFAKPQEDAEPSPFAVLAKKDTSGA